MYAFSNIKLNQVSLKGIQKFRSKSDPSYGSYSFKNINHKITPWYCTQCHWSLYLIIVPVQPFFKVTLPSYSSAKKLESQEVSSIADRQCVYGHILSDSPIKDSDGSILCNQMILRTKPWHNEALELWVYISGKPLFPMLQLAI